MQESYDNTFVVFLHIGWIKKLRTVCVYLSLFSTPAHFWTNNMYLAGGPVVAVYVKQGLYMLWYWHREKRKINVVVVIVSKSGEGGNSSKGKIQAFALPT